MREFAGQVRSADMPNRMRDMAQNRCWQLALQHYQRGSFPILVDRMLRTRG